MNPRYKYIIGLVIIGLAFSYLVYSSFKESFQFAVTPSEIVADPAKYSGQLKITGIVEKGSLTADGYNYSFSLTDGGHSLKVHYTGVAPNTFREGAEVVVSGKLDGNAFYAHELIAKCASKYESR